MTTAVAIIFMLTSLSLSYTVSRKGTSLMEGASRPATQKTVPAQKAAVPTRPGSAGRLDDTPLLPLRRRLRRPSRAAAIPVTVAIAFLILTKAI